LRSRYFAILVSLRRCGHGGCIHSWDAAARPFSTSPAHSDLNQVEVPPMSYREENFTNHD
jgi:hypothetical protein